MFSINDFLFVQDLFELSLKLWIDLISVSDSKLDFNIKIDFDSNSVSESEINSVLVFNIIFDSDSELNSTNYSNAKKRLQERGETSICIEDIYIEIIKNGDVIQFTDYEGEEFINLHIEDAVANFNALKDEEKIDLAKLLDEDDCSTDVWDCFNAIQYALYGEVIFG